MNRFGVKSLLPLSAKSAGASLLLMLGGCGPLISFGDDGPADEVYSLEFADARTASGDMAAIIYLEEPLMSSGLGGNHVAVALDNNQRTNLKGVRWSANSTDLIRDFLVRSISSSSGVRLLGEGAIDVQAGCRLGVKVWSFEFVPGDSARDDRVDVEIEFILIRYSDNRLIGQPTFAASPGVASAAADRIVAAFQNAMTSISADAGAWLSPHAAECSIEASR